MKNILVLLFVLVAVYGFGQERKPNPENEEQPKNKIQQSADPFGNKPQFNPKMPPQNAKNPTLKEEESSKKKRKKPSKSGKHISIKSESSKNSYKIYEGEKIILKTRKGDKFKGRLSGINAPQFSIGDTTLELNQILKIRRGFIPVFKKRIAGTGLFIGGLVVTGVGTGLGYLSATIFEQGGPVIVLSAVGVTSAIGINIVGVSICAEGVKLGAEKVSWKIGDKWKASLN